MTINFKTTLFFDKRIGFHKQLSWKLKKITFSFMKVKFITYYIWSLVKEEKSMIFGIFDSTTEWITFLLKFNFFCHHVFHLFIYFVKFIGVTFIIRIIYVSSIYSYATRSVYCTMCPPPKVKPPYITIYLTPCTP